jgi:predicted HicB family RNase H-like nuclease
MDKTHGDKDPSVTRNIRLPAPLLEAIKVKASAERRSINQWVVNALQDATEGKK